MTEIQEMVKKLAQTHGKERHSLLPIMQGVVREQQHLSNEAMLEIARELDIASAEVYGTASFYSFLNIKPYGQFVIRVCKTIVCDMHGKRELIETLEDLLKIKVGETTHNQKFTLLTTNCLGWCHKGPVMLINNEVYTEMNAEKARKIIASYRNK